MRRRAQRDAAFAAETGSVVRNFWDALAEIEIVLSMRTELARSRRILIGAAHAGRVTTHDIAEVGTLAREAAGTARDRLRLFLTVLALHRPIAAIALDVIDALARIADVPVTDDIFNLSYADAIDAVRRGLNAEAGPAGPLAPMLDGVLAGADMLLSMSPAVRAARSADVRRLESEIRGFAVERLLPAADRRLDAGLDEMTAVLAAGGRLADCELAADLEALVDARRVFQATGLENLQREKLSGMLDAVERKLSGIARSADASGRIVLLDAAVETARLAEPVCGADGAMAMMRRSYAAVAGRPPPDDNAGFLLELVRMLNRRQPTPAA
jgi:hypothetical protein